MREVLSIASPGGNLRGWHALYRQCESPREFVIVDHRRVAVVVRCREGDGARSTRIYGAGEAVALCSLPATVPSGAFYEDVELQA